jgi:hypothetical protein
MFRAAMTKLAALAALLSLSACSIYTLPSLESEGSSAGESSTTDAVPTTGAEPTTDGPGDGTCDFAGDIQPIFSARCISCHGAAPQAGLSLAEGAAHAALVGVASTEVPARKRVEPGDLAASYLVEKLGPAPSVGDTMPLGGSLPAAELALISAWITAGAPETATFACAEDPASEVGSVDIDGEPAITVPVGEVVQLQATVTDIDGDPLPAAAITWTSSGELTLFADGTGALLGIAPGTVQLTASADGVTSAPVSVEVIANVPPPETLANVLTLTRARCGVPGCHVDGVEPGDLRFDRDDEDMWEELLEPSAVVPGLQRTVPNAPSESYLVHKLVQRSPAAGAQMPIGAAPIDAASAQILVRWILAGAPQ